MTGRSLGNKFLDAAKHKDEANVLALFDKYPDLINQKNSAGNTVLEILAAQDAWPTIFTLLAKVAERKIELKHPDNLGRVVWYAVRASEQPPSYDTSVTATSSTGTSFHALQMVEQRAAAPSSKDVIPALLAARANLNVMCSHIISPLHPDNINSCTALFLAIRYADKDLIQLLYLHGAETGRVNHEDLDALGYAKNLAGPSLSAYQEGTELAKRIIALHTARSAYMRVLGWTTNLFHSLPAELFALILNYAHGETYREFASPEEKMALQAAEKKSPRDIEIQQLQLMSKRISSMQADVARLKNTFCTLFPSRELPSTQKSDPKAEANPKKGVVSCH